MKKQLLTAALAGLLSASAIMTSFASGGGVVPSADGTDVYAGIVLEDPDAKVSVKVPTLFAFVVNGTVDSGATDYNSAVTSAAGTVLLPNVKVQVLDHGSSTSDYSLQTVGTGTMRFENCSTARNTDTTAGAASRMGVAVSIRGSIRNEGSAASRKYWEHVANADAAALQGQSAGFKKYTLSVDGKKFNTSTTDGGYQMSAAMTLDAPDLGWDGTTYSNMNTLTNYANTGSLKDANFDVFVGGIRKEYKQVEESAKVGTIVWTVGYDIANSGEDTSPSLDPLQPN